MVPYVVAIDHPSLHRLVEPFVETLRAESRRFDRGSASNPKPFPSVVRKVTDPRSLRFGVMQDGRLLGMGALSSHGEVTMAMAEPHRGKGFGTMLFAHIVETAEKRQYGRLTMESNQRSAPITALGERFGWSAFEAGRGRLELILELPRRRAG